LKTLTIIGGGLAGCEAAWQAASRGTPVTLHEMKPEKFSPAHHLPGLAELVCSNSLRGDSLENAVGLLKEELRRCGSLVMEAAQATRVPAGGALAVDRQLFSDYVTRKIGSHPLITLRQGEVSEIPAEGIVIIASGPLTSDALANSLAALTGERLYFYDAIAPIVSAESLDMGRVFAASRYGKGDGDDYLNCPLDEAEYLRFVEELVAAEKVPARDFEKVVHFEGCMPVETMAERGVETLRFGPMKPVGLTDPKTGRFPYAAVQLRQDTLAGDHYSLVGFQTQLKWGEQARVLHMIPGLEQAEFVRFGMVHRNTYICGPKVLLPTWQTRHRADLFFAGQVSGVEGYVESAASGLVAGRNAAALARGEAPQAPPRTTAIGSLGYYVSHADPKNYQPTNITHGIMPPLDNTPRDKMKKKLLIAERALAALDAWRGSLVGTNP